MASNEKTRYKAIIADHTYTIIGQESKQHMDLVTKLSTNNWRKLNIFLRKLIRNKLLFY